MLWPVQPPTSGAMITACKDSVPSTFAPVRVRCTTVLLSLPTTLTANQASTLNHRTDINPLDTRRDTSNHRTDINQLDINQLMDSQVSVSPSMVVLMADKRLMAALTTAKLAHLEAIRKADTKPHSKLNLVNLNSRKLSSDLLVPVVSGKKITASFKTEVNKSLFLFNI